MSTNFVLTLTLIQLFIDSRSIDKRAGVFPGKMCSDEVLEGKFRNLNFSPFTKKTTENCFKLFLSIYRYQIFFSSYKFQHCQTIVLLNKLRLLRALICNFHLGPCKIEKSKIAKLCHNKGLPKPFIKI